MPLLWFLLCHVILGLKRVDADCRVETEQGALAGSVMISLEGKDFCAYRGIPYAAPPVGENRFKAPQPASGWTGVRNATEDGHMCLQTVLFVYYGHEDCLYLNVFAPQTSQSSERLPVLVFFHGGAYILGSGSPASYGPHYVVDKGIVVVTVNYRLGILGFLSTGDDASPGNYALKDQTASLTWIRQNIERFGGDPDRVTIMGESAGAFSVHYHMLSPLSKGLFHAGIADSGSALMSMAYEKNPLAKAVQTAELAGCPTDNTEELVNCLRYLDADTLMGQATDYDIPWRPTAEVKSAKNPEPFLLDSPENVIRSQEFNKVPFLIGANRDEGALFLIFYIGTQNGLDVLNANFEVVGKKVFLLTEDFQNPEETLNKIANFYLGQNHTVTPENVQALINAASDRFMTHNIQKSVELHLEAGHDSVYLYNFAYRGKYSLFTKARYGDTQRDLGVLHIDELEYILSSGLSTNKWEEGHPDLQVLDAFATLWTNFVKHGNPTPPGQDVPQNVTWPPAGSHQGHVTYFVFGHESNSSTKNLDGILPLKLSTEPDKFQARIDFWDSLQ